MEAEQLGYGAKRSGLKIEAKRLGGDLGGMSGGDETSRYPGKWLTYWLLFVMFNCVFCHFPMWYPGSGDVLDCIDS